MCKDMGQGKSESGICRAIDPHQQCMSSWGFGSHCAITWPVAAATAFFDGLNDNAGPRIRGSRPSGAAAAASQQLHDLNAFSESLQPSKSQ